MIMFAWTVTVEWAALSPQADEHFANHQIRLMAEVHKHHWGITGNANIHLEQTGWPARLIASTKYYSLCSWCNWKTTAISWSHRKCLPSEEIATRDVSRSNKRKLERLLCLGTHTKPFNIWAVELVIQKFPLHKCIHISFIWRRMNYVCLHKRCYQRIPELYIWLQWKLVRFWQIFPGIIIDGVWTRWSTERIRSRKSASILLGVTRLYEIYVYFNSLFHQKTNAMVHAKRWDDGFVDR